MDCENRTPYVVGRWLCYSEKCVGSASWNEVRVYSLGVGGDAPW